jgi:hypothetical protein
VRTLDVATATAIAGEYMRTCQGGHTLDLRLVTDGHGNAVVQFMARGRAWSIGALALPSTDPGVADTSIGDVLRSIATVLDAPGRYATIEIELAARPAALLAEDTAPGAARATTPPTTPLLAAKRRRARRGE